MAKRRQQAHAQDADVLARLAESRLDVAPTYNGGILERNMALTIGKELPIEGECLLCGWRLEQGQVALLPRHRVEHRSQLPEMRLSERRNGDVHAAPSKKLEADARTTATMFIRGGAKSRPCW